MNSKNLRTVTRRIYRRYYSAAGALLLYLCSLFFASCSSTQVPSVPEFQEPQELLPEQTEDITEGSTCVVIRCDTQKSRVYLNNTYQGITPLTIQDLMPGFYHLTVHKDGFESFNTVIQVKRSLRRTYYIQLKRPAV